MTLRDGVAEKTAREWLEQTCDMPEYMDPFGINADISLIKPREDEQMFETIDSSQIRVFVLMKEKPKLDEEEALPDMRPPWDINTNIRLPPKYLKNGTLNPARFRPPSAKGCQHFKGVSQIRPFSAPCGFYEFSNWKHPLDIQPYLSVGEMRNLRRYSSAASLSRAETSVVIKDKVQRLLSSRSSRG